jgi:hypothetical protein
MNNTKPKSQTPLRGVEETDPRQRVVSTLSKSAGLSIEDWMFRVGNNLIVDEILYLEEAYGFDLDSFLDEVKIDTEYSEEYSEEEVRDFLHSFVPFGKLWPTQDPDFSSQQEKHQPNAIEDWEFMLDFALKGREVSRFLSLDKDSMINEFIIPYYKVSQRKVLDLEDLTEIAFSKGTKKAFGFEIANSTTVLDRFFELETSDFVSIFEYILAQQDEVLKSEDLKQKASRKQTSFEKQMEIYALAYPNWSTELVFDNSVQVFYADEISNILANLPNPEDLQKQTEGLGKVKLTFGYAMPSAYIEDSLRIAKELNIEDVELLNFLQGFALLFDGDALGCFYEAWDLDLVFTEGNEYKEYELKDLRLCRKFLIGSMIAWQSHEVLKGDCLVTVKRLAEDRLSVCWRTWKGEVIDFEEMTVKDSLQGKLCDFRFELKIQAEEREGSEGTKN